MAEDRGIDLIDYVIIIAKKKWLILSLTISILILSYFCIYFFVDEQFEATALIIPSEEDQISSLSSMVKGFSNLPLGLGDIKKNSTVDLYITIIYSRSNLEAIIKKFDLLKEYKLNSLEKTIKALQDNIKTKETKEGAFIISAVASSREKSANMTNFIVDRLNEAIIALNITRSRENRIFLENRYSEIKENLRNTEDSLKTFQEKSKMYIAEDQTKAIIETFSKLEAELSSKQIELSILEKIHGTESPQFKNAEIAVKEFQLKLASLKSGSGKNSFLLSVNSLPKEALSYYRLYREVMINEKMLEIILPLYENAKFQEKKDAPILQVIDRAVPPELKAYPKRGLSAILITFGIMFFVMIYFLVKESFNTTQNPKLLILREQFRFRKQIEKN